LLISSNLRVTPVQTSLHWHNPKANRFQLGEKLAALKGQTDLVILPEMFTSGFTAYPETAGAGSETISWLLDQSKTLDAAIVGSIAFQLQLGDINAQQESPSFVNRLLCATPSGELFHYDKVHLFRMAGEHKRYQAGDQRCVVEYRGWRLLLTVCYDLRFPVFCCNQNDYDALVCVANWPEVRSQHWRTLLEARAIENQSYVVGVNRVGVDGKGLSYSGDSMVLDYLGNKMIDRPGEWLETVILNKQKLVENREKFPVWKDADHFSLDLMASD